jgi:DNA repair protein RadC
MIYEVVSERKSKSIVRAVNPRDVFKVVKRYAKSAQEQFILVTLNSVKDILSVSIVSIGLANKTLVHPREVFHRAIRDMAQAVIICHNHPSGNCAPSDEDLAITAQLKSAGEILGIPLLDHIIFTKTDYNSLCESGVLGED